MSPVQPAHLEGQVLLPPANLILLGSACLLPGMHEPPKAVKEYSTCSW